MSDSIPENGKQVPPQIPPRKNTRPTLKTISERTGFAVATVSRALKDASDIGEDTKKRVRAVAAELGYRPNRAGVRLRTGKTNVISLVISTEEHVMNHTAQLIYSISKTLTGTAYHLTVTPYSPQDDPMGPIRYIVETASADGVIMNQTELDDPRVRYLSEHNFPFATHGRTTKGIVHANYDFDNSTYAGIGVDELVRLGRRRLLLIPPPVHQTYGRVMFDGFVAAADAAGIEFSVSNKIISESSIALTEAYFTELMARPNHPDGLIFASPSSAMAAIAGSEAAGRVIGRDFDVIAKEAVPFLQLFRKEIIVLKEDVSKAGRFLTRALVDIIEGKNEAPRHGLEIPNLDRKSDGP